MEHTFNWTINCSNGQSNSANGSSNGTKQLSISDLNYNTTYTIWVNTTDIYNWTRAWYTFTTQSTPVNNPPTISNPSIENGSINVSLSTSSLSVTINEPEGNSFNWTIETSPNIGNGSGNDASNGTKSCNISELTYSTTYYWFVNATDGNSWTCAYYYFTTDAAPSNNTFIFSDINPSNKSTGVPKSISSLSITIYNNYGDAFNWTIETSPDIGSSSGFDEGNGCKTCNISGLAYSTTYYWFVNVSNGNNSANEFYYFKTESKPSSPSGGGGYAPTPQNNVPFANAGGPYYGFVNETITFDGSSSNDSDGSVVSYNWNFGDGTTGSGVNTSHIYFNIGNYTVTLTVIDNLGASNSDTTYVVIYDFSTNESNNTSETGNDADNITKDDGNENILHIILQVFGLENKTINIVNVSFNEKTYYLIDIDNDNRFDFFFNPNDNFNSTVLPYGDGLYYIDSDGDGEWDFSFNETTKILSQIEALKSYENQLDLLSNFLLIGSVVISIVLILIVLLFKDRISLILINYRLNKLNKCLINNKRISFLSKYRIVHFFSDFDDKKEFFKKYFFKKK